MNDDAPTSVDSTTGGDPSFSITFSIRMPHPAFEAVETPLYQLLRTGTLDDHVGVWPERAGRVLFAHAPVAATSASGAMTEGRRVAEEALTLCPSGSVVREVRAHDWDAEASDDTTFWAPEDVPQHATSPGSTGSVVARWWSRRRDAPRRGPSRRRDALVAPTLARPAVPVVEFVGVAPGEADLAVFPYEFVTDTGVMVRLHDMQFVGLEYLAGTSAFTLRFLYDDPAHTPAEARHTPMAVFRFSEVEVRRWEDLDDPGPDPNRITAMLYVERHGLIELVTGRTHLIFTTRRMSVSMESST